MKTRLLLLFVLFIILPNNIQAYDYRLKKGETLRIDVPKPLYGSDYTYLDHTNWTCISPVEIVSQRDEYVIVRASKAGSGSVSWTLIIRRNGEIWIIEDAQVTGLLNAMKMVAAAAAVAAE